LVPHELGGSNDLKNLWPQPDDPRPGDAEKDQLENELHHLVCSGKMPLADAQKCIESNWVECWEKYMVPGYGSFEVTHILKCQPVQHVAGAVKTVF
jgi:hypothetical protein